MTGLAVLTLSGLDWLWPVVVLALLGAAGIWWSYSRAPGGGWRAAGALLKLAGLGLLAWCLLEPLWSQPRARPGANLLAIVADTSQGLQVRDRGEAATRAEELQARLGPAGGDWQTRLEADFELRRFTFDSQLRAVAGFEGLTFDGQATALGGALASVRGRFADRPLAGILLFTDGNATDLPEGAPDLEGLPPVYPVVLGREGAVRDVAVTQTAVTQSAFEDAPVAVQADVRATGWQGESLTVWLEDAAGTRIEEQTQRARRDDETLTFRFRFRPPQPGWSFYRVRAGRRGDLEAADPASSSDEATWLNNERIVAVQRGGGPYRVLYVAGRPNWEYKFLNRAILEDDQTQLVALIRIALREPKFDFRGRAGETGNPLFRGFGDQSREAVERYDQPVIVRLNTRDEFELRSGFPQTPADLFAYDAVILDDVEAGFFSAEQASLLQRFVAERGGGFAMLGGAETFREGNYHRNPIGDMLPVYLDRIPDLKEPPRMRWSLTREGVLQPWMRLHDNEPAEKARRDAMPAFEVQNLAPEIKPGASIMATTLDDNGVEWPALVTQRFGRGRTAALTTGDVWRWGMRDQESRADMNKFWRQLVRWLVADVPRRVELAVEPGSGGNSAVDLVTRVRNPDFEPLDEATVAFEIQSVPLEAAAANPPSVRLRGEPSLQEAGRFEATFAPRGAIGFLGAAVVTDEAGAEVGRSTLGWTANPAGEEFRSLQPNRALLETIARRTGGKVVDLAGLAGLAGELPQRQAPVMETWVAPAWHSPWLFLLALGLLITEWGLRRRRGLP